MLTSDAGRYLCKSDRVVSRSQPGFLKVVSDSNSIQLKHKHQVSEPGQPHISQAVGGEVIEVGQGGHLQGDSRGQVMLMIGILMCRTPARALFGGG